MKQAGRILGGAALWCLCGLAFGEVPIDVAYVTNQDAGITVIDLALQKAIGKVAVGQGARGVGITPDGKYLLAAVQSTGDVAVVDTETMQVVRRIPVGPNVEFLRVQPGGKRVFVTYEPGSSGKPEAKAPQGKDDDDKPTPAKIAIVDLDSWKVVARMQAAPETEGVEFSPDGRYLLVANEGNNTITVYDLKTEKVHKVINVAASGDRPRGVKALPHGRGYAVTMENSNSLLIIDARWHVVKSVPTGKGPYGVAIDPNGKHIWVAAARDGQLQSFDIDTFERGASIAVGKRCWHFSFLGATERILLACGRSNALDLVDTQTAQLTQTMDGYDLPWGIVTYPKSEGSLDAP